MKVKCQKGQGWMRWKAKKPLHLQGLKLLKLLQLYDFVFDCSIFCNDL